MKTTKIVCDFCGKESEKPTKEVNRWIRKGRTKFYCDNSCSSLDMNHDDLTPFRRFAESARKTSKRKGLKTDITVEFLKQLYQQQNGICPYSGLRMILSPSKYREDRSVFNASLDRIDSSKGYVKGNVEFTCVLVNFGKNTFSKTEVEDFFRKVKMGDGNA
jgi:hypothetical protein